MLMFVCQINSKVTKLLSIRKDIQQRIAEIKLLKTSKNKIK